jgi:hypothetical protein
MTALRLPDPPLVPADQPALAGVRRILDTFVAEALPGGGIASERSPWQAPGTGSASGGDMFPGVVDVRYLRFLAEALYRAGGLTGQARYVDVADAQVSYLVRSMRPDHPTWAWGNALELIGLRHAFRPNADDLAEAARRIISWAQGRRVEITTPDGVRFAHYPCGYGLDLAADAGWTNDLSMFGSGLVWAYGITGDPGALAEAVSFAEFFLQPWRPNAVGSDGYWHCGTWHEGLGSWVIGPAHYSGFESTGAYSDEASWVFSTMTCTDYLLRLHAHHPDPRLIDRCLQAAEWTFRECQFEDGAVGMCGRDDRWLGLTGNAVSQVAMLQAAGAAIGGLLPAALRAKAYIEAALPEARIEEHGVQWVTRQTSLDPLVNVGMLWAASVLGWLNGRGL